VLPLLLPPAHDEPVALLVAPGLEALGDLAPGRGGVTATRRLALAAAHRVIHRIHRDAADRRIPALPAVASCLADRDVLVLDVADLPHHRAAVHMEAPHFPRGQTHLRVIAVLGHELAVRARRARHARAPAREQLDVVHVRAERDVPEREAIAVLDLGVGPG